MKNLTNHVRQKIRLRVTYLLVLLLIAASCKKDNDPKMEANSLLSKVENKTLLSKNVSDLPTRLDAIEKEFYARKLDVKFAPKDDKGIIWTPEWSDPKIQTINDSVSYVFYRLTPSLKRDGKIVKAREAGAATYIMVKNEKEFYRAFFYLPENKRSKNKSDDTPELIMKNFTGKLLLSNLERKQSFLLDYKNGSVSDAYKKNQFALNKLQSVGSAISYWETQCSYQMTRCTYTTYFADCGGQFIVEYSFSCQVPSYCSTSLWTLTDYSYDEVCEQVWYPDPPTDPGTGGTGGDDVNAEDPDEEDYELEVNLDSLKIVKMFDCFENVTSDENTSYLVKICADIPVNDRPNYLLKIPQLSPGHTFLEITKSNGGVSVTETIGFYPKSANKATAQISTPSMMVNDEYHPYDTSYLQALNAAQFETLLTQAKVSAQNQYNMTDYNCTTYAMEVFNSVRSSTDKLVVPDWKPALYNFKKTPNGLNLKIKDMYNNLVGGASIAPGTGVKSGECN